MGLIDQGGVSEPLGSAGRQPAVFAPGARVGKTRPAVPARWARSVSNDDFCQWLAATNKVRLAGKRHAVLDVDKTYVLEFSDDGRQRKIVEAPLAGLAFQPGAVTPHAKGSFGIANGSAGTESPPKKIPSHPAKIKLPDLSRGKQQAAAAPPPARVD